MSKKNSDIELDPNYGIEPEFIEILKEVGRLIDEKDRRKTVVNTNAVREFDEMVADVDNMFETEGLTITVNKHDILKDCGFLDIHGRRVVVKNPKLFAKYARNGNMDISIGNKGGIVVWLSRGGLMLEGSGDEEHVVV